MKQFLLLFLITLNGLIVFSQEKYKDGFLPQYLTKEEKERIHEIYQDKSATDPPVQYARSIAEFEPMTGALIRYPLGIPYSLVALMSEEVEVVTIVASQSVKNQAISDYQNHGVNMDNASFIIAPTNSIWTRDYGPWYIFDGDNEFGIIDFQYDRPRPDDNAIPSIFANENNINYPHMGLVHTGGDFMSTGMGIGASTNAVYSVNSDLDPTEVDSIMDLYLGIEEYHVVPNIHGGLSHIDTWAKFLAPDKIMIREVDPSHQYYDLAEQAVAYFESQTSSYGTPFRVYRVYTPNNEPYTNSLILNDRVYLPTTGSPWDDAAVEAYEAAMPGYTVYGVYYNGWWSTDALHCRVREIPDSEMLYIHHIPTLQDQQAHEGYQIDARIIPMTGQALYADSLKVYYQINGGDFSSIVMTGGEDNWFSAEIPQQDIGSEIGYYIFAADASGRRENHPYIGPCDPHQFTITGPLEFTGFEIDDSTYGNDNGYFEPGETVELMVTYQNNGNEPLSDIEVFMTTESDYISINAPDSSDADQIEPGATHTFSFVVSALADTPDGYHALIDLNAFMDGTIMSIDHFSVEIHAYVIDEYLIYEDFDAWLPEEWETTSTSGQVNWQLRNSSNAGGAAPEARFQYNPATEGTQRLISPVVDTSPYSLLSLSFWHSIDDFNGNYQIRLETSSDAGASWNDLVTFSSANMPATLEEIILENGDVGSESFRIAWTFEGNTWNINYWYVDEVRLGGFEEYSNHALIEGQVTLAGGNGAVEDTMISAGDISANPDENGFYQLSVPAGTYQIVASIENYIPQTTEEIDVEAGDTIHIDFIMPYMAAPEDLDYDLAGNSIMLHWVMEDITGSPVGSTMSESRKSLTHFNIYRGFETEGFDVIDSTSETHYIDHDLANGSYNYFVTAIYNDIYESQPSDTVTVDIEVATSAGLETTATGITNIFPNPFRSETTIGFYLDTPSNLKVAVYNVRGQKINILINSTYSSGNHKLVWDGTNDSGNRVPDGLYLIRFQTSHHTETQQVIINKMAR